jgi:hypothetical protein
MASNNTTNAKGMNMSQIISLRILTLVNSGMELKAAFDAVLGLGAFDKLAGELYDGLKA